MKNDTFVNCTAGMFGGGAFVGESNAAVKEAWLVDVPSRSVLLQVQYIVAVDYLSGVCTLLFDHATLLHAQLLTVLAYIFGIFRV